MHKSNSNISLAMPADLRWPVDSDWVDLPPTPAVNSSPPVDLGPAPLRLESETSVITTRSFATTGGSLLEKSITKIEAASVIVAWGGMVTAGGLAGALGASPGIIAGIAVGVFFGVGLIAYGISTYLESKQVNRLDDSSDDLEDWEVLDGQKSGNLVVEEKPQIRTLSSSRLERLAPHIQEIANNQTAGFPLSLDSQKVVSQARKVETAMSTEQKREITKTLNQQIRVLRNKFAEYAVKVGFAQAFRILDKEIAKDESRYGALLYVYSNDHAGVNLRDLILKGEANIDNVQGGAAIPNFTEVKQGVLSDIQLKMSHAIQNRFHELADRDLSVAINRLELDFERASNISEKQLNKLRKAGFNESNLKINTDSIAKNLGHIYRFNPSASNPHFNSLVQGVVSNLLRARAIEGEKIDRGAETSIEILATRLTQVLAFNDKGRTIAEFKMQSAKLYNQEVEKIKEKENKIQIANIQKGIAEELPVLKEERNKLQRQLILNCTELRDTLRILAIDHALIFELHKIATEKAQADETTETDQNTNSLAERIIHQQRELLRLRAVNSLLKSALQENKDKIDEIENKARKAQLPFPAYSQQDVDQDAQIQTLLNECGMLIDQIDPFVDNSSGKDLSLQAKEILNGTSEILHGTAPTVVQKVTGGVAYGASAAYSSLTYISSAIWNRVPAMPTLGGWFGGSKTAATTKTAEIVNADSEIDGIDFDVLKMVDETRLDDSEDGFVPLSPTPSPSSDVPGL